MIITGVNTIELINCYVDEHCNPHVAALRLRLHLGISVQLNVTCHSMLKQAVLDKLKCHVAIFVVVQTNSLANH